MNSSRREALGLGLIGVVASALPGAAGAATPSTLEIRAKGRDYGAALAKLRDYAIAELAAVGLPGMTISVADADGFAAAIAVGWADVEAQAQVRPDHLFEIGSISKSITALCIHSLVDDGLLDLDLPISQYLHGIRLPETPISTQQLLNHTSGLAHDAPAFPDTPDARLWTGFAPGSRASYSNIGYLLLGLIIARVTGRPHPDVIRERVLIPLGMTGASAHLLVAERARYVTGYVPMFEDRPVMTRSRMVPGQFAEGDFASGTVAASGEAMLGYLRYVLALGRGSGGPIMSDKRARTLLERDVEMEEFGPGARYASGFAKVKVGGVPTLHHTGGMDLFTSSYHVDPASGVGCFASVNGRLGPYRPRTTTEYGLQLLRAVRDAKPLPPAPDPLAYRKVEKPASLVGRWFGPEGRSLELTSTQGGLRLSSGGSEARVELSGRNELATDHPLFDRHLLTFETNGDRVTSLWWGEELFGRNSPPQQPIQDPSLRPLTGVYSSGAPAERITTFVRGEKLHLEGMGELALHPDGFWSPKKETSKVTRLWFNKVVNDTPYQVSFCGFQLQRLT
jgi:CubicO group peptidase (beta-lactamase class C family)